MTTIPLGKETMDVGRGLAQSHLITPYLMHSINNYKNSNTYVVIYFIMKYFNYSMKNIEKQPSLIF